MAGTWAELAAEVEGTGVIVADVDATANPITTDRFKGLVKGFPTLLLFRDRGVFKYTGARDWSRSGAFATETFSAKSEKHDVPEPLSAFARYFSLSTRALAVFIIERTARSRRREDGDADLAVKWVAERRVRRRRPQAPSPAAASPRTYGAALILFAVVGICVAIILALITAPMPKSVPREKKDDRRLRRLPPSSASRRTRSACEYAAFLRFYAATRSSPPRTAFRSGRSL